MVFKENISESSGLGNEDEKISQLEADLVKTPEKKKKAHSFKESLRRVIKTVGLVGLVGFFAQQEVKFDPVHTEMFPLVKALSDSTQSKSSLELERAAGLGNYALYSLDSSNHLVEHELLKDQSINFLQNLPGFVLKDHYSFNEADNLLSAGRTGYLNDLSSADLNTLNSTVLETRELARESSPVFKNRDVIIFAHNEKVSDSLGTEHNRFGNEALVRLIKEKNPARIDIVRASQEPTIPELDSLKEEFAKQVIKSKAPTIIFAAHGSDNVDNDILVDLSSIKEWLHGDNYYSRVDEIISKAYNYFNRGIRLTDNVQYSGAIEGLKALQAMKIEGKEFGAILEKRYKQGNHTSVLVEIESCFGTNFTIECLRELAEFKKQNPDFNFPTMITASEYGQEAWGKDPVGANTSQSLYLLLSGAGSLEDIIDFQRNPENRTININPLIRDYHSLISNSGIYRQSRDGKMVVQVQ